MPNSLILVLVIELALVFLTTILLVQPSWLFRSDAKKIKTFANWVGLIFLCLTFCWSIVVGAVLSMNGLTIRI